MNMKVFITGGTGFIGSEVIKELVAGGYEVVGLARSAQSKQALKELGAAAVDGSLEDLDSLKRDAVAADAVIHCAFIHNFADFAAAGQTDKAAIESIGYALAGSNKPLIVTSGVPGEVPGHVVTENDVSPEGFPRQTEQAALPFAQRGVDVRLVRPSRFVYSEALTNGFISALIGTAAQKGTAAYVGDGSNHTHAVHVSDLAKLYVLALKKGANGAKYQGVGDSAVSYRDIATAIGKWLNVPTTSITPEQAAEHFGFLGQIVSADNPASSEITQTALDWRPTRPTLLDVLKGAPK
ncbi:MAG: SDR family oxidoreductase [Spirochaetaceae bacterium]|jgi:nucleoside-diphosphate-sugar epimerase|nr:SDR family oxidoreductase [Spirochaetaceae bacterium]